MNFLSFDDKGHPSKAIYDVINYQDRRLKKVADDNNDSFLRGFDFNRKVRSSDRLNYFPGKLFATCDNEAVFCNMVNKQLFYFLCGVKLL